MRFQSEHQHCIEQIHYIEQLMRNRHPTTKQVMFLLSHTALQGLDAFQPIYTAAIGATSKPSTVRYMKSRRQEWLAIQNLKSFKKNFADKQLVRKLYSLNKPYFERGRKHPEKLLVVFTTMYNSFYISNLALLSFLQDFGVSVLFLKDSSIYNYLNGIHGYGDTFEDAMSNLNTFITDKGFEEVYVTGFSSSGFASLLASCMLPCRKYIGFSIRSDLAPDSAISPGKYFTEETIAGIPDHLLRNLAGEVAENADTAYKLIYGSANSNDAEHANNLRDCDNVEIEVVERAGHVVISPLLIKGQFKTLFRELFSAA